MKYKIGVVMDPISSIDINTDSTIALLLETQRRGWSISYMEQKHLFLRDGVAYAYQQELKLDPDAQPWFQLLGDKTTPLSECDVILMRLDPPVDMEYIYTTHILTLAERAGTLVVNNPQALRDFNEKLFVSLFPQCSVPTCVTADMQRIHHFLAEQQDIIGKPLDGMGGESIFRIQHRDPNANVIIETLTQNGKRYTVAQKFIPEISQGDKRIILIDGEASPYVLIRMPALGEVRANLHKGGRAVGGELTDRDRWICQQIGPTLREKGLFFVGIDVIGGYLTEINITSPSCIVDLKQEFGIDLSPRIIDCIEKKKLSGHTKT